MEKILIPDKMKFGDYEKNLPTSSIIQASGSSYCGSTGELGTLGVRVKRDPPLPNNYYYWVATYHNYAGGDDFDWLYLKDGQINNLHAGKVVKKDYELGPDRELPFIDAALIELENRSPKAIRRGVFNVWNKISGTAEAAVGDLVVKYGMTTGKTYGVVNPLPANVLPVYDNYLVAIQHTDFARHPVDGPFASGGDSGAPVMIIRGPLEDPTFWVAGIIIQAFGNFGLASRIDQIEARFKVAVVPDA